VNLLVVVVGISIAFYLEEWKSSTAQIKDEIQMLTALDESLEYDSNLLDTLITINKEVLQVTSELSRFHTKEIPDSLAFKIYRIFYLNPFAPQVSTYESMKLSGSIRSIENFELKSQILELYENYYHGTKEFDRFQEEYLTSFYRPYVINDIVWPKGKLDDSFLSDGKFKNIIIPLQNILGGKMDYFLTVREQIDSTRTMINNHLNH